MKVPNGEEIARCHASKSRSARASCVGRQASLMMASSIVLLVALAFSSPSPRAEIIRFDDMLHGTTVTAQQCAAKRNTVWVSAFGQGICMRYYLSDVGGKGRRAVVFLSGDKPGIVPGSQKFDNPRVRRDVETSTIMRRVDAFSRATQMPTIQLARMGVDGSSGDHRKRRTQLELQVTNAALDAIKRRHGFDRFDVFGNSGGSTLIAGLLPLRSDLNCAVLGSGRLSDIKVHTDIPPATQRFDPFDADRNSSARIFVVTDPQDKIVPRNYQDPFVEHLREVNRQVEQFYVNATGDSHHQTRNQSLFVVSRCIRGRSDQEIAEGLRRFEIRRVNHRSFAR
jgi:hypothetical protein